MDKSLLNSLRVHERSVLKDLYVICYIKMSFTMQILNLIFTSGT